MIYKLSNLAIYLNKSGLDEEACEINRLIKKSVWAPGAGNPSGTRDPAFARSTGNQKKLDKVSEAIKIGDAAEPEILENMRNKASKELIELCATETAKALDEFVLENPGVDDISDLSEEKRKEITTRARDRAVDTYKNLHPESELIKEYLNEVSRSLGLSATPPTVEQLLSRYLYEFIYQFVFGFIDNFVLILAASVLDQMLAKRFGTKGFGSLISAGIGNLISDVMGDIGGVSVEQAIEGTSLASRMATDEQLELADPAVQKLMKTATTTGVAAGCIVGLAVGLMIVKGIGGVGVTWAAVNQGLPAADAILAGAKANTAAIKAFEALAAKTITATTLTAAAIGVLIAAGILGNTWLYYQKTVYEPTTIKKLNNAKSRFVSRIQKLYNTNNPYDEKYRPSKEEYNPNSNRLKGEDLLMMIEEHRDKVQGFWNQEMSMKAFGGDEDIIKKLAFEFIAAHSALLGLDNPNA